MKNILSILSLLITVSCFAQVTTSPEDAIAKPATKQPADTSIFLVVERAPEYPGGKDAMTKYIHDSLKYPKTANEMAVTGTCYIGFVVEKDGAVTQARFEKEIPGAPDFNKECLRVVSAMPHCIPGKQNGQAVRVRFILPIKKGGSK